MENKLIIKIKDLKPYFCATDHWKAYKNILPIGAISKKETLLIERESYDYKHLKEHYQDRRIL